jgi:hypothetical protein
MKTGPQADLLRASVFCLVERELEHPGAKIAPNGAPYHNKIRASTDRIARDGGIIRADAWKRDIDAYTDNPVIMFAHNYTVPPVANAVYTEIDEADGALVQYIKWLDGVSEDEYDRLAHRLRRLYEIGGMRMWSVGFRIREWREPNEEERAEGETRGEDVRWVATRAELLETSAVPVPADPNAGTVEKGLQAAARKGADVEPIVRAWESSKQYCPNGSCPSDPHATRISEEQALTILETWDMLAATQAMLQEQLRELERQQGTTVQTLVLPKSKWDSLEAARKWVGDHDFKTGVDTTEESWRFRQRDPGDFKEGALDSGAKFATICLLPNGAQASSDECRVKAVIGKLKEGRTTEDVVMDDKKPEDSVQDTPSDGDDHVADDDRAAIPFSVHSSGSYSKAAKGTEWDASEEVAAMEESRASLRPRHAYVEHDGDADARSSYKFPHHRAGSNMAVVFRALANGFARLGQADISDEAKSGVAAHLGRHYRSDFDTDPPEREAVEKAVEAYASFGAEARVDEFTDWVGEHVETLGLLGGGDVHLGSEIVRELVEETAPAPEPTGDGEGDQPADDTKDDDTSAGEGDEGRASDAQTRDEPSADDVPPEDPPADDGAGDDARDGKVIAFEIDAGTDVEEAVVEQLCEKLDLEGKVEAHFNKLLDRITGVQ